MSFKFSSSYFAFILLLFSRHVMMDNICVKFSGDQEIGKKLPVSPFKVLYQIGLLVCFRDCEAYGFCLSINFNRNMLMCELNDQKRNTNLTLVHDNDFIYRDIPGVLDYRDKKCGSLQCNQYSKCVRTTSNQHVCIAIEKPRSCMDILRRYPDRKGKDGVYSIFVGGEKKSVLCDMSTDQGGWTVNIGTRWLSKCTSLRVHFDSKLVPISTNVIHRRQNSSINFYRPWNEYRAGFGDPSSNYWLGNDAINALTIHKDQELRVGLESFEGEKAYALYSTFYVENVTTNYKLNVSGFSGTAGDSLTYHNGMDFSTYDNDNDNEATLNCATTYKGAWWYNICHSSNLNGMYSTAAVLGAQHMVWYYWKEEFVSLKGALMMIRTKI